MSTNKLDERFKKALEYAKGIWWVVMFFVTLGIAAYGPTWAFFLLIPLAFVIYAIILFLTVNYLAATTSPEEVDRATAEKEQLARDQAKLDAVTSLAERQAAGEKLDADQILEKLNAAGVVDIVKVTELGPAVGTYRDKNIYEYIVVKIPKHTEDDKLMYYGPANIVDGIAEIPVIDGMIFACVDDILYVKETNVQQK